ncbi:MAG: hypothetical protein WC775_04580 [Patescibacteria group bacterium]|jgi:hypothetical protein
MINLDKITNPEALRFAHVFLNDRLINREFYLRVPEDKLDFQMTPKSDSIRKSLIHQIDITREYIHGITSGKLEFHSLKSYYVTGGDKQTKLDLLKELDKTELELITVLEDPNIAEKTVSVPWVNKPIPALTSLWGMDSHEILHTGWNLALMDHLGIERFPELKAMWG